MPSMQVAGETIRYSWTRQRPMAGLAGSWTASMTEAPWLSGTGGGQPAARRALAREVLAFRARQAYRAAESASARPAPGVDAWATFEAAVDQLPEGDRLREELRAARACHEAHVARVEAKIAARWTAIDAEQAAAGFQPAGPPGFKDRAVCRNCGLYPEARTRTYQHTDQRQRRTVQLCPCCWYQAVE